ncbi:MAG: sigma-70 family RNA polymerase sigma factor [bacterium]|nr:sigma-70 family RNA polymerase sigma factor [bacterium]
MACDRRPREDLDIDRPCYKNELNNLSPLSKQEQLNLLLRSRRGDSKARELLILSNLRLVVGVAKRFSWATRTTSLEFSDLVQFGIAGLIRAVEKHDCRETAIFSTYAVWWIRQFIHGAINSNELIRIPNYTRVRLLKGKIRSTSSLKFGLKQVLSLDRNSDSGNDVGFRIIDTLSDKNSLEPIDILIIEEELERCIGELNTIIDRLCDDKNHNREQRMFCCFYGIDDKSFDKKTLRQVGEIFGLTRERVRQCINGCFKRLAAQKYALNNKLMIVKLKYIQRLQDIVGKRYQ